MADLQQIVDRIIADILEPRLTEARAEIGLRLMAELASTAAPASVDNVSALLNSATAAVQSAQSQVEILSAMLEGASGFAGRVALFVMRGSSAVGWQARGFSDNGAIKQISVDPATGSSSRAIRDRMATFAAATEFSNDLVRICNNPDNGNAVVVPLLVRDKVPALLYADAGLDSGGAFDTSALELLVRSTGIWLELLAARRVVTAEAPAMASERPSAAAAAVAPPAALAATPAAPVQSAPEAAPEAPPAPVQPITEKIAAFEPAPSPGSPEEDEVHRKARRFAKLLVDEIRLYNQSKVAEGRQKRDLYDRLKDDIDKSRATYEKRYGSTSAASGDYFTQELVRILAENDASLLGSNFPRA